MRDFAIGDMLSAGGDIGSRLDRVGGRRERGDLRALGDDVIGLRRRALRSPSISWDCDRCAF